MSKGLTIRPKGGTKHVEGTPNRFGAEAAALADSHLDIFMADAPAFAGLGQSLFDTHLKFLSSLNFGAERRVFRPALLKTRYEISKKMIITKKRLCFVNKVH